MKKNDIRVLLKNYKEEEVSLSINHQKKFKNLLTKELHTTSSKRKIQKRIAMVASVVVLLGAGVFTYTSENKINLTKTNKMIDIRERKITLGNVSPELHTIESYYTNSINQELEDIEITSENKELLDGYMGKIEELTTDYKILTEELNEVGVNDNTVIALIDNLKLRLSLLQKLQNQLKELKHLQENKSA